MKSKKYIKSLLFAIGILSISCEKDIPTNLSYEEYEFSTVDENGGNWKPILIENGSALIIESPDNVDSDAYKNEVSKLKEAIASIKPNQQKAINYWTNNPLVRWNEITLELIAKYNLQSLLHSGSYVESDISAGTTIGDKISEIALSRAATDGMKKAQTNKAVSDSIKSAAFERFGWQWENLEIPVRPVGLTPLFGKVTPWNIENIASVRPVAPPKFDSAEFLEDVAILKNHANNMTTEKRRISNFWQDGTGTYTPPGHWNRFANEFIVEYHMNPLRSARTMAYLNMAMMDAGISCWDTKYYYHYPRPIQMIEGFKTIAGTPNFPSYTSGHSVFSAAGAEVLAYIFPEKATLVRGWAEEAAISRVYGGLHWTFDAKIGTEQGKKIAQLAIDKAKLDGSD